MQTNTELDPSWLERENDRLRREMKLLMKVYDMDRKDWKAEQDRYREALRVIAEDNDPYTSPIAKKALEDSDERDT